MDKVYRLEKQLQFWEIAVDCVLHDNVSSFSTTIRAGKRGYKGRKYPAKSHTTYHKAHQFALQQVNSKIIQGFEPVYSTKSASRLTRTPSIGTASDGLQRMRSVNRGWRKPPKKQNTVRKLAQQRSIISKNTTPLWRTSSSTPATSQHQRQTLSKQSTLILDTSSNNPTTQNAVPVKTVTKWRKPHKKQSTIRRMAKGQSCVKKAASLRKVLF